MRKKRNRKKTITGSLMLIPLIDIFTNILLFLIMSYSAEGQILTVDPKFKLPVSTSQQIPKMKLVVQVTEDDIIIDGERITGVKDVIEQQDLSITPLVAVLEQNTKKVEYIARSNAAFKFTGDIIIQGDKRIPFNVLEKIMFTCGQAGYSNISLAVFSRD
jgi:biopolymer transport protein ExbD